VPDSKTDVVHTCLGCGQEIDPNCCGCGDTREAHGSAFNVGHSFVPMGCDCNREPPEPDGEAFRGREAAAYEAEQMAEARKLK